MIDEMRAIVKTNCNSEDNIDGCLVGTVDDYLASFEAQNQQMMAMFDKSQEQW